MRTLTDIVIDILADGGLTVGDGTGEGLTPPFVVVYPLPQSRGGTLAEPWEDVNKTFQVTCEAVSRQQAEWLADRATELLLAADGLIGHVRPDVRPEVRRDDTTGDPSRFKAWPRFRISTYDGQEFDNAS
jgi:hypothetical protein